MPGGRPVGPSKLTPELQEHVCELFRLGVPIGHTCDKVGISHQTFNRWIKAGKLYDDPDCVEFVRAIKAAKSDFVRLNMEHIQRAAEGKSWQAAAWLLERRLPDLFSQQGIEQMQQLQKEITELKSVLVAHQRAANEQR